ncbi:sushi, von Willebrand factor type A, EGF and pentraxin domain-containing protein 1-like isoform X3 [Ciona intestinalis]
MLKLFLAVLLVSGFITRIEAAGSCRRGYYLWRRRFCLKVSSNSVTWDEAVRACAREGAGLAVVQSENEMRFVRVLMMSRRVSSVFIGLQRQARSRALVSSNGGLATYRSWRGGEPRPSNTRSCVTVAANQGYRWALSSCDRPLRFVCKYFPGQTAAPRRPRQRCYVCDNARTNEECNARGMRECMLNEEQKKADPSLVLSCQNEIRVSGGRKLISKKCKQPTACENNYLQNPRAAWYPSQCSPSHNMNSVCRCCCTGDLCNVNELPCLSESSCPALSLPAQSTVSCSNRNKPASVCTFSCRPGYKLTGSRSRRCNGQNGNWTNANPTCQSMLTLSGVNYRPRVIRKSWRVLALLQRGIRCSPVQRAPPSGAMTCTNSNYHSSTCSFTCERNFFLRGPATVTCQQNERWSSNQPRLCTLILCTGLRPPSNGEVSFTNSTVIGQIRTFSCSEGYRMLGSDTLRCVDSNNDGFGEYDNNPPTCERITCPLPSPVLNNGDVIPPTSSDYGSVTSFRCDFGYFLIGSDSITCVDNNNDGVGVWDGDSPICRLIECPVISPPDSGRYNTTFQRTLGTQMFVVCDPGFSMVGLPRLTCIDDDNDGNGSWDNLPPICEQIYCPDLPPLVNGMTSLSGGLPVWGATASFNCDVGYFLEGARTLECVDTNNDGEGNWNQPLSRCRQITCPTPTQPTNGRFVNTPELTYGSVVAVTCDVGYFLIGQSSRECGDVNDDGIGEWNGEFPTCTQITCDEPLLPPQNGEITESPPAVWGSVTSFECDVGYFMEGGAFVTCEDSNNDGSGEWNSSAPVCNLISCPLLVVPMFGSLSTLNVTYGTNVTVTCNEGYFLIGQYTTQCGDVDRNVIGDWLSALPRCELIMCPTTVPSPLNGVATLPDVTDYASVTSFRCDFGYFLIGSDSITCVDNNNDGVGEWDGDSPICKLIECPVISPPESGRYNTTFQRTLATQMFVICDPGFSMVGLPRLTCIDDDNDGNGSWDNLPPICEQIYCPDLPQLENGNVTSSTQFPVWGSEQSFNCDVGFFLIGSATIRCVDDDLDGAGEWDKAMAVCQQITCPIPTQPTNGRFVNTPELTYGSVVEVTCDVGYFLIGQSSRECGDVNNDGIGEWNGEFPTCTQITCLVPVVAPQNGSIVTSSPDNIYGSDVTFDCDVGFFLIGSATTRCGDSNDDGIGEWTNQAPVCDRITCSPLNPPDNGVFIASQSLHFGATLVTRCLEGYYLVGNPTLLCKDGDNNGRGEWNGTLATCSQITCDEPLLPPQNGEITNSPPAVWGSVTSFNCDVGYFMDGEAFVTCEDSNNDGNGEWNSSAPVCNQILCPVLISPDNATIPSNHGRAFGDDVTMTCDPGFFLIGRGTVECGDVNNDGIGEWTSSYGTCEQISCPDLQTPINGFVTSSPPYVWGSVGSFGCSPGYYLNGSMTSLCDDVDSDGVGDWTLPPPVCELILCPDPGSPSNGVYTSSATEATVGSLLSIECFEGFTNITNTDDVICASVPGSKIGRWIGVLPFCTAIICNGISWAPPGGMFACSLSTAYGSNCAFRCSRGYHLVGSNSIQCGDANNDGVGEWSADFPVCNEVICIPSLSAPSNGSINCTDFGQLDSQCHFSCDSGFFLRGNDITTCNDDDNNGEGEWSSDPATCREITCQVQNSPVNGSISCTRGVLYGSACFFECNPGYSLVGYDTVLCGEPNIDGAGQWSIGEEPPTCISNECSPESVAPKNGSVTCSYGNLFESECVYTCAVGYRLVGSERRSCLSDSTWNAPEPICELLRCLPVPVNPQDGLVFCTNGNVFGSVCNFFCDLSYERVGASSSTCSVDTDGDGVGEFIGGYPLCEPIYCDELESVEVGGRIVCGIGPMQSETNRYGSECVLVCDDGWRPNGPSRATCLGAGRWTANIGSCIRYQCFPGLPTPAFGFKTCTSRNDALGTVCNFSCDTGRRLLGDTSVTCQQSGTWTASSPTCVV